MKYYHLKFAFTIISGLLAETIEFQRPSDQIKNLKLVPVTVATDKNDGLERYLRSAEHFDLVPEIIGLGETWVGGNLRYDPGGAQKINLLKSALKKYENEENTVLLFTDAYDVIFQNGKDQILDIFNKIVEKTSTDDFKTKVIISAEDLLWPDHREVI